MRVALLQRGKLCPYKYCFFCELKSNSSGHEHLPKEYHFYDPNGDIPAVTSSSGTPSPSIASYYVTLATRNPMGQVIKSPGTLCVEYPVSNPPHQSYYESPHSSYQTPSSPPVSPYYTDYQSPNSNQSFASPAPSLSAGLRRDRSASTSTGRLTGSRQTTPVPSGSRGSPRGSFSNQEVMYESGISRDGSFSPFGTPLNPPYSGHALSPASPQSTTRRGSLASSSGSRSRHGSPVPNYSGAGAPSPAASARSPLGR